MVDVEEVGDDGEVAAQSQDGCEEAVAGLEDASVELELRVDSGSVTDVLHHLVYLTVGLLFFADPMKEYEDLSPHPEDMRVSDIQPGESTDVLDLIISCAFNSNLLRTFPSMFIRITICERRSLTQVGIGIFQAFFLTVQACL